MNPTTVKLFLVEGKAQGLRTAEISNWVGKALAAPRSELKGFLNRDELSSAGVYVLAGVDDQSGLGLLYIGEAEDVAKRISQHTKKDFWVSAVAFVSKDGNLTKAHTRYLEGKLIEHATLLGLALDNAVASRASLPESDAAEMDFFFEKIIQLLPILGVYHFTKFTRNASEQATSQLYCRIKGLVATGNRTETGFVVYQGSEAVREHRVSATWAKSRREELLSKGVLKLEADRLVFTKDHEFSSPSLAASIVRGGNSNGLIQWVDQNRATLRELESGEKS